MDITTAQLYDLLVEKGFEKSRVRAALSEIVTNNEMEVRLEGLEERLDRRFAEQRVELYRALSVHGFVTVTAIIGAAIALANLIS
jgi:hypothetical protein